MLLDAKENPFVEELLSPPCHFFIYVERIYFDLQVRVLKFSFWWTRFIHTNLRTQIAMAWSKYMSKIARRSSMSITNLELPTFIKNRQHFGGFDTFHTHYNKLWTHRRDFASSTLVLKATWHVTIVCDNNFRASKGKMDWKPRASKKAIRPSTLMMKK